MSEQDRDEAARLRALWVYQILDTPAEKAFDDLTHLAAHICQMPISLISLIDCHRQWFKSRVGLEAAETPRSVAFCSHTIRGDAPFIVEDASRDERFADNPLVVDNPHIRFYAGVPLVVPSGHRIGTLCVIDQVPRRLSQEQLGMLQALGRQVVSQMELRRTNAALQGSENRLRTIIAAEPEGVQVIDSWGILREINPAGLTTVEAAAADEVVGQPFSRLVVPDHRSRFEQFNQQICEGESDSIQFDITSCRGDRRSIVAHGAPLVESDGQRLNLSIMRDITLQRQAELALTESESVLRSFFDNTPMMMGVVELLPNDILHVSDNALTASFFGLAPAAMRYRRASDLGVPQNYIDQWLVHYRQAAQTGEPVHFEYPHSTEDGEHWLSATVVAIPGDGPQRYAYLVQDVSDRKADELALQEQAMLLDIASDAIVVRDLENKILFWNEGARRVYGWTVKTALGQDLTQLLQADPRAQQQAWQQVIEHGEWQGELHKRAQDGLERIVRSRWSLVRNRQNQPASVLSVDTDITEQKSLEAQFLRAQRLESLGTLAGGIAHDLNNMLTPILGIAQLLPELLTDVDSQTKDLLEVLVNSASRGTALVQQVLTFAQGVEGQTQILAVGELIAEVQHLCEHTFPKSITIATDTPPGLWTISGDSTHLHQVLMNLCVNARDAMIGGGRLTISAENQQLDEGYPHPDAKPGAYVAIRVEDTGKGMAPGVLERIFDPFFTTKQPSQGTGLGLSTVIGIVKSYQGFVDVRSQVGAGTCFEIYLPAVESAAESAGAASGVRGGHHQLILLVDDEATIRDVTKVVLQTYNYRVLTADNGLSALKLYKERQADIQAVIMDMMMPVMDGQTAIHALRQINPELKIIATSGLGGQERAAAVQELGVKRFLPKPYSPEALVQALSDAGV